MTQKAVDLGDLVRMRRGSLLGGMAFAEAAYLARDRVFWRRWTGHALLALGAGHFLSGVIFFFAFNWDELTRWQKFSVLEVGVLSFAILAMVAGSQRLVGQVALIGATVMTGLLLAVTGQVYQTGADTYELFAAWAFLTLPWVLLSRSAAHWVLWGLVVYLGCWTFLHQVFLPLRAVTWDHAMVLWSMIPGLFLVAFEAGRAAGFEWLRAVWPRHFLLFAFLGHLFVSAVQFLFESVFTGSVFMQSGLGALAFCFACALSWRIYGSRLFDLAALTIVLLGVAAFFAMLGARGIESAIGDWSFDLGAGLASWGLLVFWSFCCLTVLGLLFRHYQRHSKVVAS
ncbi:DUF2157 domain-containing protein [Limibacillus sp. MBR-115]|uniref:DUF2157 domain-containing protein n=1 Tax=Limibacillus sp. MBR-115 TaxID=3156465 RepID=UPI0033970928